MSDKVSDERVSEPDLQEYLRRLPKTDDFVGFQRTAPIPVAVVRSAFAELLSRRAQQQAAGWKVKPLEPVAWNEPPLTCPHIDAAVASGELSPAVISELSAIREINSQLRYGTWALKAQLAAQPLFTNGKGE